jgi:hypothetical protein
MDPLVTAEDLASYLQRDLDRSTADLAVAGASGAVRGWCLWDLSAAEVTFTVDGSGSRVLALPTLHLESVEEVRVDGEVIDPSGYTWSAGGLLERAAGWPRRFRAVDVDCHHGYDPIPDLLRLVSLERAARQYDNPQRLASKSVGGVSQSYELTELEMAQLGPYRLP